MQSSLVVVVVVCLVMLMSCMLNILVGNIHGAMDIDMTNALRYLKEKRESSGVRVTITALAAKAVGAVSTYMLLHWFICVLVLELCDDIAFVRIDILVVVD